VVSFALRNYTKSLVETASARGLLPGSLSVFRSAHYHNLSVGTQGTIEESPIGFPYIGEFCQPLSRYSQFSYGQTKERNFYMQTYTPLCGHFVIIFCHKGRHKNAIYIYIYIYIYAVACYLSRNLTFSR
jgi:hypothetical protein